MRKQTLNLQATFCKVLRDAVPSVKSTKRGDSTVFVYLVLIAGLKVVCLTLFRSTCSTHISALVVQTNIMPLFCSITDVAGRQMSCTGQCSFCNSSRTGLNKRSV